MKVTESLVAPSSAGRDGVRCRLGSHHTLMVADRCVLSHRTVCFAKSVLAVIVFGLFLSYFVFFSVLNSAKKFL